MNLLPIQYEPILRAALTEDIGAGDITTQLTVPQDAMASARVLVKAEGVLCGLEIGLRAFTLLDPELKITLSGRDGQRVSHGTVVAEVSGRAQSLLTAERVCLNVMQRMSGVATMARRFADAVEGTGARVVDTRKTTPLLRHLEKYAVRCGGAHNHRWGLGDGILIKDNHLAAGGGVAACVGRARKSAPHPLKIEVECKTLVQVKEAVSAGADLLLLDNMPLDVLREAVILVGDRAKTEASGGVNLQTVRAIAETGVSLISVGALTHSAPALDISLDFAE
jgi:nicotinate-nucleotide pyrophosphorylase (carboxylating)